MNVDCDVAMQTSERLDNGMLRCRYEVSVTVPAAKYGNVVSHDDYEHALDAARRIAVCRLQNALATNKDGGCKS